MSQPLSGKTSEPQPEFELGLTGGVCCLDPLPDPDEVLGVVMAIVKAAVIAAPMDDADDDADAWTSPGCWTMLDIPRC